MAQCEMCGNEIGRLSNMIVEGAKMDLCKDCSSYGKKAPQLPRIKRNPLPEAEPYEELVISQAGSIIKSMREKKGMRQVDLAKMLQMKDSFLHHIETGDMKLPLHLAKKIEEALDISLIKKFKKEKVEVKKSDSLGVTLGDLIKHKIN